MAAVSHERAEAASEEQRRHLRLRVPDMWVSLAIAVMWLAVMFDAIFGPDIVSSGATSTTRIPSAIVVALFAYLATRVVARYGFEPARRDRD